MPAGPRPADGHYPYNKLQDARQEIDDQGPKWTYARPGSVLEGDVSFMCAAAHAALTEATPQAQAADPQMSSTSGPSLIATR